MAGLTLWTITLFFSIVNAVEILELPVVTLNSYAYGAPTPVSIEAVYDQNDTIYIFSRSPGPGLNILPYSISKDRFEPPVESWTTQMDTMQVSSVVYARGPKSDTFYLLASGNGDNTRSKVWKLTFVWKSAPDLQHRGYYKLQELGTLEERQHTLGSIVSDQQEYIYIVGGMGIDSRTKATTPSDRIYRISMATDHIDEVVQIPWTVADPIAIFDQTTKAIFVFYGVGGGSVAKIGVTLTTTSFSPSLSPQEPHSLPGGTILKQVVWVTDPGGDFALLFHAYTNSIGEHNEDAGWEVSKWSPSNATSLQPVELQATGGFRPFVKEGSTLVYVNRDELKRVYIFGGGPGVPTAYIDLGEIVSNFNGNAVSAKTTKLAVPTSVVPLSVAAATLIFLARYQ